MKDLPVFQTEYGVASLVLCQIPLRREAYVRLQAVGELPELLQEIRFFCRACGAERIFCAAYPGVEQYPLETRLIPMEGKKGRLPRTDAALRPVTLETAGLWREIYNRRMAGVPHAALFSALEQGNLPESGCYFVYRGQQRLGIGRVEGNCLWAIASEVPGSGTELVAALAQRMPGERIRLEVASANRPAMRLYERLGFFPAGEGEAWYQIDRVSRKNA